MTVEEVKQVLEDLAFCVPSDEENPVVYLSQVLKYVNMISSTPHASSHRENPLDDAIAYLQTL